MSLVITIIHQNADDVLTLQDKLLAKMDNDNEEKVPYSSDDQVRFMIFIVIIINIIRRHR